VNVPGKQRFIYKLFGSIAPNDGEEYYLPR